MYGDKYKKKYCRLRLLFAIVVMLFGITVFLNIDYLIFKVFISAGYVYTETLDEIYAQSLGTSKFNGYFRNFDRVAIAAFTEKIRSHSDDSYTYLYTPVSYRESKAHTRIDAEAGLISELSADTAYIRLPNISSYTRKLFVNNRETLGAYANLVLDLRSNYGGMLNDYYKIADLFLEKKAVIGYEDYRLGFLSHTVVSRGKPYFDFENVIILQDSATASSAEGLIAALKENLDNVTLIGETTFGKGIGQATVPLTGGYAVKATVLKLTTPDGGSVHRLGIAPDIELDGDDDLIAAALAVIRANSHYGDSCSAYLRKYAPQEQAPVLTSQFFISRACLKTRIKHNI